MNPNKQNIKTCLRCKEDKQINEFYLDRTRNDKFYPYCKFCTKKHVQDIRDNQELIQAEKQQKLNLFNQGLQLCVTCTEIKPLNLFSLRGKLYRKQCIICNKKKKLVIDHSHKTLKVRGLLCYPCNTLLGYVGDDINILEKAIQYLRNNE